MRRKPATSTPSHPALFDDLDNFKERQDTGFDIIPPAEMEKIAERHTTPTGSIIDDMPPLSPTDKIFFMSFGSGSSGNCAYIGDRQGGFLIDAGVDAKKVTLDLQKNGITMDRVKGIVITHDHHDHISQAYSLLRSNRHMKLFCTPRALNGILRRHNISRRIKDYHTPVYKEFPFTIGNFTVTPFEVMHDGSDNAGFHITRADRAITIATDLGCISPRVDHYMRLADTIVIEANYDLKMLLNGSYPEYLKARIRTDNGHLDNAVTAAFIASIHTPRLKSVFLCHLSHDNNTPATAFKAMTDALETIGIQRIGNLIPSIADPIQPQINLIPLPRYDTTILYTI
ncbi:MAG: MBL fold metallo-hydrolase [Duncaniella sp.]|nr:MBL fold metallo-hydrolase [Duncaniella sp.]MDE5752213.1 MBL fold metallo-hydrolase [Duncaniella sp.]MDE5918629.1 MBL fold metallo-hydrolase [Duncaniella sp.]MDE6327786.1 MBL fold metallo-hydrolase [Duncaniella sp.]MDE6573463.1 MBL fold metallo-hydrolase [Duncaniella sp.]